MKDERVKLPLVTTHILWVTAGVSGITFVLNEGAAIYFTHIFLMFAGSVFGGIFSYGLINLIGDIRRGRNVKGVIKELKKNIKRNLE